MSDPVISVRNLVVEFATRRGTLRAIDGVSFDIAKGEVLGVVGESGAGKSVTGSAIIGLIEPPGRIAGGQILLNGSRIDNLPPDELRKVRGRKVAMIFQDPLTSLNPLFRVGEQLVETIRTHLPMNERQARDRAVELLTEVGIPAPEKRIDGYPHEFRAACASAWSSRSRSAPSPTSSSPTSRPPRWTSRCRRRSSRSSRSSAASAAPP